MHTEYTVFTKRTCSVHLYKRNRGIEVELGTASRNLAAKPQQANINTDIIQIQIQLQTQIQYI